ncbi:MAG: PhzF family phenazine biosynthesis protein [Solirubrobacterales bacterium]|nr:PhzF family phenazine biosynthesis protein [Solirubrobacterales bacterium]
MSSRAQELVRRYVVVDVFTEAPLEGNQLAVLADGSDLSDELMQRTAREMNLSETVFVLPPVSAEAEARVRIFTPGAELPFAGHPVLGTAFVLGAERGLELVRLETGAGVIPVALQREAERIVFGEMEQPVPQAEPFEHAAELLRALGLARSELPVEAYRNGPRHVYVAAASEAAVAAVAADLNALAALGPLGVNVTAGGGGRFKTRNYAPGLGVPEDPATGSAAGPLAIHLVRHGRARFGERIEIRQGIEIARPSVLYARVEGSPEEGVRRVLVGGSAVTVARGEYRLR